MPDRSKNPIERPDAAQSMGLLTQITSSALDPEYVLAYAQRKDQRKHALTSQVLVVLVMAILGLGLASAANTLREPAPEGADARVVLTGQIEDANAEIAALEARSLVLSGEIQQLQADALALQAPELAVQITSDEMTVGALPISGGGLRIKLTDGPDAVFEIKQRVMDTDLQTVVNGLWQSGAQGIAINSVRITPLTSIRAAGEAVLVGLTPISSPYEVAAIGSPEELGDWFDQTYSRNYLNMLSSTYNIGAQITRVTEADGLTMPGARISTLRHARAVE